MAYCNFYLIRKSSLVIINSGGISCIRLIKQILWFKVSSL